MQNAKVRWNLKEGADRKKFQRNRKTGMKASGTVRSSGQMKWQKEKGVAGDEVRRSTWGCMRKA